MFRKIFNYFTGNNNHYAPIPLINLDQNEIDFEKKQNIPLSMSQFRKITNNPEQLKKMEEKKIKVTAEFTSEINGGQVVITKKGTLSELIAYFQVKNDFKQDLGEKLALREQLLINIETQTKYKNRWQFCFAPILLIYISLIRLSFADYDDCNDQSSRLKCDVGMLFEIAAFLFNISFNAVIFRKSLQYTNQLFLLDQEERKLDREIEKLVVVAKYEKK